MTLTFHAGCGTPTVSPDGQSPDATVAPDSVHWGDVNIFAGWGGAMHTTTAPNGQIEALFVSLDADAGIRCVRRADGPCRVIVCNDMLGDLLGLSVSAGTLTIAGGNEGPVTPIQQSGYYYFAGLDPTVSFNDGAQVTLMASGDVVPAFQTTATFPPDVWTIDPAGAPPMIDHTRDFTTTWRPTTGNVEVAITTTSAPRIESHCIFPGAAGTGTIPASALADFVGHTSSLQISGIVENTIQAGRYEVTVRVRNNGYAYGAQVR